MSIELVATVKDDDIESMVEKDDLEEQTGNRTKNIFYKLFNATLKTQFGRRVQIANVLCSASVPFVLFLFVTSALIGLRTKKRQQQALARESLEFSIDLTIIVHVLQKERDIRVVYTARDEFSAEILTQQYISTDQVIRSFSTSRDWKIKSPSRIFLRSADDLLSYVTNHRLKFTNSRMPHGELVFYGEIINALTEWLGKSLPSASIGATWKVFVSLNEVVKSKEMFSKQRAYGSLYFINGGFREIDDYYQFTKIQDMANDSLSTSREHSKIAEDIFNEKLDENSKAAVSMRAMGKQIRSDPTGKLNKLQPSLTNYRWWFDNVTLYLDQLLDVRQEIASTIRTTLDKNEAANAFFLTCIGITSAFMAVMYPVVIIFLYTVTKGIQKYLIIIAARTKLMKREQQHANKLLYSMLPRSIAQKLKEKKDVAAEYFEEATLFFSDIVDFTGICSKSTTIQVVYLLDDMYSCFDQAISAHDVYKVTTIGDSYMMVSGVPIRNGHHHAAEICTLALDIMERISHLVIPHMMNRKLQIRIGIHTGSVTGGVLTGNRPRYHLFGQAVTFASKMESTGLRSRIQISSVTWHYLQEEGGFICKKRTKQVDNADTYWLMGKHGMGMEQLCGDSNEDEDPL